MNKLSLILFLGCAVLCAQGEITSQPIFDWTPNEVPSGTWITAWGNVAHLHDWGAGTEGKPHLLLAEDGFTTNYVTHVEGNSKEQKYQPWEEEATPLSSFTFCAYGSTDFVEASEGKYSVLWCMGRQGKIALVKDSSGNIKLLQLANESNPIITEEINAGPVSSGFHLFTVRFDTTRGASLRIDDYGALTNPSFTTMAAKGLQVGSVLGEPKGILEASTGFIIKKMIAFDTDLLSDDDFQELCQTYPPTTHEDYSYDGRVIVKRGTLDVPAHVVATASGLEFGDSDKTDAVFGDNYKLNLAGQIFITGTHTFEGNDVVAAYNACNAGAGVIFGEWKGDGTYNIVGENAVLSAPNSILVACYTAGKQTINVDGGFLEVKGITCKVSDTVEINLTGGGSINYGRYPSAPNNLRIAKNYGNGTIIVAPYAADDEPVDLSNREKNTVIDTDDITLTDSEVGTTLSVYFSTAVFSGAISGTGRLTIDANTVQDGEEGIDGEVVLENYQAGPITVLGGVLSVRPSTVTASDLTLQRGATVNILVDEDASFANNQVLLPYVEAESGAKFTINGQSSFNGYSLVLVDGVLRILGTQHASESPVLRISEIMPKPSDLPVGQLGALEGMDVNGLESGWVELENTSDEWANLADYRFIRVNRSKKTDVSGVGNFPERWVAPHSRTLFYTSERYSNSKDKSVSAFATGTFDGKPQIFPELNTVLVWGDKVNPKKSPFVRLYFAPEGREPQVLDTVVIPTDLPEGHSVIVGHAAEGEGTRRWICPTPTRGTENTPTENLVRVGPTVGPLYEISTLKKTDVANEFVRSAPPAVPGEDYPVTLAVNAVMNPNGTFTPRDADAITRIRLIYRKDLDNATLTTNEVDLTTLNLDAKAWGDQYTATIPHSFFPAAGHLIQWKALITDTEGTEWTAPAFNNKDDGYEWYGTIVEPGNLNSASLPTWHMFAESASLSQMDIDVDDQTLENNARVAIYDASTSNYYDYVRIDLRGNSSAHFKKKSHGLRFAKAHPVTMTDIVTGKKIDGFRKTSLISEFADPSRMRQMMAFWLLRKTGNKVPFDFPVRCNLNGEFYQLAFHSERFTDELLEDYYGLDKFGYGYKNVATLKSGSSTTSGTIEKKTPDDGNENDLSVLQNELRSELSRLGAGSALNLNNRNLTKFVVCKFNLPSWINYLASTKVTGENDDVWGNISIYYDNAQMKEGVRGTDTWMPLAYDMNLSFGQWYVNDAAWAYRKDYMTTNDWHKSHPLYGGSSVRCWNQPLEPEIGLTVNEGNLAFEAVWQSDKFRRLYLRRLRTLMDQELKAPGVAETEVPFMIEMRRLANLMREDAALDFAKWTNDSSDDAIDIWKNSATLTRPSTIDEAITEIWQEYVLPRRTHLYVTHSATNTAREIGYNINANAGIPTAQSPIATLRDGFSATYQLQGTRDGIGQGVVVIENANEEVVDLSGWKLEGPVSMTLPEGTVIDGKQGNDPGTIMVTANRRKVVDYLNWINKIEDQIIIGDGTDGAEDSEILLTAADGTKVVFDALEVVNGDELDLNVTEESEAAAMLDKCKIVMTREDVEAGLTADKLMLVAEEVTDEQGDVVGYKAKVAINPEVVPIPQLSRKEVEEVEPFVVNDLKSGEDACSLTLRNAVPGLWYGCEMTDDLRMPFVPDVDSFIRATSPVMTIEPSPQSGSSAFFRVRVSPVKMK